MIDAAAPETKLTMSVQEMAYQLGIGRNKAYELVKQRDFPAHTPCSVQCLADNLLFLRPRPGNYTTTI